MTDETKNKISNSVKLHWEKKNKGRKPKGTPKEESWTPQRRKEMAERMTGRKVSEATRKKMSDSHRKLDAKRFRYFKLSFMSDEHQHFQDLVLADMRGAVINPFSCKCGICRGVIANEPVEQWEITRAEKMFKKRIYTHLYGMLLDEARKQKKIKF